MLQINVYNNLFKSKQEATQRRVSIVAIQQQKQ